MNNDNKQNREVKIICPKCKSESVVKRGTFTTQAHGKQQRYFCKSCNKKFIPQTPFYRMRNSQEKITCALDLFYRGLSTREVQSHFQAFFPHNSDHSNIYRWIVKYANQIGKFTDRLKVNSGERIEVDEMEYLRRKSHKAKLGAEINWCINAIDVKTRFLLCSNYTQSRNTRELKSVLEKAKNKSDNIKIVTTDGLTSYTNIVKKTWGYDKIAKKYNIHHNVVTQRKGEGFNIWVERLHNSFRQRTQNFRGFHGSVESANAIMHGMEIFYNFVRKHEALKGRTPSDIATNLNFETKNRWLELINLSQGA